MNEDRRRILDMLAEGKITADQAEKLLDALGSPTTAQTLRSDASDESTRRPKFLRISVNGEDENVDIRVPFQLFRAGIKLGALLPQNAADKVTEKLGEKGINFDLSAIKPEDMDELVQALGELQINVNGENEQVRIYCE